jgi:hypothetical protein
MAGQPFLPCANKIVDGTIRYIALALDHLDLGVHASWLS